MCKVCLSVFCCSIYTVGTTASILIVHCSISIVTFPINFYWRFSVSSVFLLEHNQQVTNVSSLLTAHFKTVIRHTYTVYSWIKVSFSITCDDILTWQQYYLQSNIDLLTENVEDEGDDIWNKQLSRTHILTYVAVQWLKGRTSNSWLRGPWFESCAAV